MNETNGDIGFLSLLARLDIEATSFHELMAGAVEVTDCEPIHGVVGASVAVCLFDTHKHMAGACCLMLPSEFKHHRDELMLKADSVLDSLRNRMVSMGCTDVVAKIFGGADIGGSQSSFSDGKQTTMFVRGWLRNHSIPIANESIGGTKRREIVVVPESHKVFCKQISMSSEFLKREKLDLLSEPAPLNKIELF